MDSYEIYLRDHLKTLINKIEIVDKTLKKKLTQNARKETLLAQEIFTAQYEIVNDMLSKYKEFKWDDPFVKMSIQLAKSTSSLDITPVKDMDTPKQKEHFSVIDIQNVKQYAKSIVPDLLSLSSKVFK